jgi:hypothetical protein
MKLRKENGRGEKCMEKPIEKPVGSGNREN